MSVSVHPTAGLSPWRLKRTVILGVKSLWMHKLRSALTALGIVFGVASVIAMLAIGEGASEEAQNQIRNLGSQNIILQSIKPTNSKTAGEQQRSLVLTYGITMQDLEQIRRTLPGIEVVVPGRTLKDFVWYLTQSVDTAVLGTVPWYPQMRNRRVTEGRFFTEVEVRTRAAVCVLTAELSKKLFPLESPLGKDIRLGQGYYRVVGIIESRTIGPGEAGGADSPGGGGGARPEGDTGMEMLIPLTTMQDRFGDVFIKYRSGSFEAEKVAFSEVTVKVDSPERVVSSAAAVKHIMETNHKEQDYRIVVPLELLRRAERTKQIFNIVLGSIAAISLLVGGIGIMNIMLATVTERTREIGIRRALGAKQRDIVLQFLIETVLLAGTGGVIGVVLGLGIPELISHFAKMLTIIRLWVPVLAFSISVLTGVVFGIYPALRAARLNPVEALRHE